MIKWWWEYEFIVNKIMYLNTSDMRHHVELHVHHNETGINIEINVHSTCKCKIQHLHPCLQKSKKIEILGSEYTNLFRMAR